MLIEVWDDDPEPPIPTRLDGDGTPDLEGEGGRGLFLVAALSTCWDWFLTQQPAGKIVWCELENARPEQLAADGSTVESLLPRRVPGAVEIRPAAVMRDPAVLRRTRDGLRDLRGR